MADQRVAARYRFGVFEADAATGELRRRGVRVRVHSQPFQLLVLLLERPGEMLTREEICRELWPDGTFVDYEHGVNSAVNRLRDALGDPARNPQFVETLARRGYRFLAPVERVGGPEDVQATPAAALESSTVEVAPSQEFLEPAEGPDRPFTRVLPRLEDLPRSSPRLVRGLFLGMQAMYLSFYVGALANLPEINELLTALGLGSVAFGVLVATAAMLIPVRAAMLLAVALRTPGMRGKFMRMWWFLLPLDLLWSLAPFLLLHHISYGLALACTTLLVYAPFAGRSLVVMGAGRE